MEAMYKTFVTTCESDLEVLDELMPMSADPFFDPSQPELIGVASLHLDSLFYLCDIRDHLPIVTFKGNKGGFLKMTARTWIDEVETIPTYICVDKESKLTDFSGQKCIIRFYFEALHDITPALSSDVQVAFTFFCHSGQYRTTRHRAVNVMEGDKHPFLNSTVVVEQKITPDFIRYIQKKCLELEIWGSRITNRQFEDTDHSKFVLVAQRVGDAAMMERVRNYIKTVLAREGKTQGPATDAVNEGCGDGADEDEITVAGSKGGTVEDDVEALKLKLKEMAIMLDKAEKNLKRTTRTSVAFRDEISKTNAKISQSTKKAELQLKEKDSEIETLRRQLEHLQEKERVLTERERVEAAKKRSTVCIIS
ncbi:unnamed protein product [Symbiodinium microadriaticum]|nr:unnamed protein product [Symbiodinium microadriaticum]